MNPNPSESRESPESPEADPFAKLVKRAAGDPAFMANAIAAYLAMEDLTPATLAQRWKCSMDQFRKLQLCYRPDSARDSFPDDVAKLAEYTGIAEELIVGLLRQCEVVGEWKRLDEREAEAPTALAARDCNDETPPATSPDGEKPQ